LKDVCNKEWITVSQLPPDALIAFRLDFSGKVILPGDEDYDSARSVWNGDIDRRPAVIARCSSTTDVVAALGFARENGLDLTVRGGGHNFGGYAIADDALMIDLSGMRTVTVDAAARRAVCGGGATWSDLDCATQEHGLAVTGGFISHTGIGGLTLGGGIGWLVRRHGLSADNLLACEVVTADGRIVNASDQENPDLFWALRGGGGNFGVVTRFEYQLHPVGPLVNLGMFFWPQDQGAAALRFIRDYLKSVPDDAGTFFAGNNAPPAPFVPESLHFAPGYTLGVIGWGTPEEHAEVVAAVRAASPVPAFEFVSPIPYTGLQTLMDESAPWGVLGYEKALYLDELSDGAIDVFTRFMPRKQSPLSFVPVFHMGGAYARVPEDAIAFGGSRSTGLVFNIAAIAPTPELLQADRQWVREFWEALRPYASGSGSYVNFMNEIEEDRVRASYGAAKYERLARVKADYDPDNVFHFNANIRPALQPA
jgi:FAD/FMN-containing dehydrogenase